MKAISISNLRSRISYFFNQVVQSSEVLIVPRTTGENATDDDAVVIISLKEYNALTETHYLLSSNENRRRLLESIQQLDDDSRIPYEGESGSGS